MSPTRMLLIAGLPTLVSGTPTVQPVQSHSTVPVPPTISVPYRIGPSTENPRGSNEPAPWPYDAAMVHPFAGYPQAMDPMAIGIGLDAQAIDPMCIGPKTVRRQPAAQDMLKTFRLPQPNKPAP